MMANPESPLAAHPPAIKVGGRRLSITSRPKHHASHDTQSAASPTSPDQTPTVAADYPRPGAPGGGGSTETETDGAQAPPHNEEEAPKKKQHHGAHDNEKKMKETAHWKVEATRPTRDGTGGRKDFGAGGRISQPAGRGFTA